MCGIAGFLSNSTWRAEYDPNWLTDLANDFQRAISRSERDWQELSELLDRLGARFDDLMSYRAHVAITSDRTVETSIRRLLEGLQKAGDELGRRLRQGKRTDFHEALNERLEDYAWQIDWEILKNVERVNGIIPSSMGVREVAAPLGFLAWGVEQCLESLDKLEIRGRDSAGVSILFTLDPSVEPRDLLNDHEMAEFAKRSTISNASNGHILQRDLNEEGIALRFVYKVANLVGKLGDNGAALRAYLKNDNLLWKLCAQLRSLNIICHTRWASNGIINVENCHPVDGEVIFDGNLHEKGASNDKDVLFVLNGDVDNYHGLVETSVKSRSASIDEAISTDAKILPVLYALESSPEDAASERFRDVMQRCRGSLAVVMQNPDFPHTLFLAQKGSGQSLYIGKTYDGAVFASEAYGLAARCRVSYPMTTTESGGATVALNAMDSLSAAPSGEYLADGGSLELKPEPIEIFSRDIFKKGYEHYIEKEIHEAPDSVRKTIQGKYEIKENSVIFLPTIFGNSDRLLQRLTSPDQTPIRKIYLMGMGTASIAAMGAQTLLRRSIQGSGVMVDSMKSSELVGFVQDTNMEDTLLVAVSQSGTTTDTNRVVDLAREKGAWIHAIVNRRNSPLVRKSDSYLYTGNGRDVEMSVASTKAYYSQVAAGKLLALWIASVLGTLSDEQIKSEIEALEALPQKIEEVLEMRGVIAQCAYEDGPSSRYWAVVGNGANRVAAEEIRIKLSELCYKSIPCDVTEDKKHIDLSTEPFTIVVANDLPEMVVQDTVKEVVIFKAHNGRPMVICAQGENRFDPVAEKTLKLPRIGGGLSFVLATVAGHLWGVEAAKAIDDGARLFRELRSEVAKGLEDPGELNGAHAKDLFDKAMEFIVSGRSDSALPAAAAARLALFKEVMNRKWKNDQTDIGIISQLLDALNKVVEESTRTIDTIRHQAKTVTVGISRPQREIAPFVLDSLRGLGFEANSLGPRDRRLLEAISPVIIGLKGALLYEVIYESPGELNLDKVRIKAVKGLGESAAEDSRYASPGLVKGTKRKALRTGRIAFTAGPKGVENVLLAPIYEGSSPRSSHLFLTHLMLAQRASLQQKSDILDNLGSKYEELEEMTHELAVADDVDDVINETSPRDLVFCSVKEILENYGSLGI